MASWTRKIAVLATALALGSLIGIAPANAISVTGILVTPPSVAPGDNFTVSGDADCITGDTLTIAVVDLGLSKQVSGDNPWQVDFTVPENAAPGEYAVTVDGEECSFENGVVTVTAAATTTTTVAPTTTSTTAAPTTTSTARAAAVTAVAASPSFTG